VNFWGTVGGGSGWGLTCGELSEVGEGGGGGTFGGGTSIREQKKMILKEGECWTKRKSNQKKKTIKKG